MSEFKLKLRDVISQLDDTTLGFVLDWADMDNNFINLKGNIISNFVVDGEQLTLTKLDGEQLTLSLGPMLSGITASQDNKFRYENIGNFMVGGRGINVEDPDILFSDIIDDYLTNLFSITVNDDELIVIKVSCTVYGTFYQIKRKYLFPNLSGKGTYNPGDITIDDLELIYQVSEYNSELVESTNVVIYPLNNDLDISGLTENCDDFYQLINDGGPYDISDVSTSYYFRFTCNGTKYIYFYDPITGGLDPNFIGTGYPATNNFDYTLFYNSDLPLVSNNNNLKPLKSITGTTYSMVSDDVNWFLSFDDSSPITVTIPYGVFGAGQGIEGRQGDSGQVTFVGGDGFTLEKADDEASPIKIAIRNGVFGLRVHSPSTGHLFGKLELI